MHVKSLSPSSDEQNLQLQESYIKLCDNYTSELFKPELKCLKNFKLDIQFNPEEKTHILQTKVGTFCHTIRFDAGLRCWYKERNLDTSLI